MVIERFPESEAISILFCATVPESESIAFQRLETTPERDPIAAFVVLRAQDNVVKLVVTTHESVVISVIVVESEPERTSTLDITP